MFEEFIDITHLKFYTTKISPNRYLCFAYEEKKIIDTIKKSGLALEQVQKVYFSQVELLSIIESLNSKYIKVDNITLSFINDILVKIPNNIKVNMSNVINIEDIILSKESISLNTDSKYIDNKTSIILSLILFAMSILFLIKIIINMDVINQYEEKTKIITSKENLSFIQLKSISKKYDKQNKSQEKIRELLFYVLDMGMSIDMKIVLLNFGNNKLQLKIENNKIKKNHISKIKKYINNRYKIDNIRSDSRHIVIEVSI